MAGNHSGKAREEQERFSSLLDPRLRLGDDGTMSAEWRTAKDVADLERRRGCSR